MESKNISLVIPILNEEGNVKALWEEIYPIYSKIDVLEVIFVDDGSTDKTASILNKISNHDHKVKIVSFRKNFGQTSAMGAGVEAASGDVIVTLDGDLQNDPADIEKLLLKLDEGYDVVSGWRENRHDGFLRVFISQLANKIIGTVTGVKLHDYGCTLKAYRSEIIKSIDFFGEVHRLLPVYASLAGAKIVEIPVNHRARIHGKSKYGFGRIGKVILDILVAKFVLDYSTTPIYFFGWLGISSFFFGTISFIGAVIFKLNGTSFIDTPLLLLTVLLFVVGVQLISMGVLADMILRTRSKDKKHYVIKNKIGF